MNFKKYADRGKSPYRGRHILVVILLSLLFLGLIARIVQLMVLDRSFLLNQGLARSVRTEKIPAYRGMITDRYGEPLAISSPVESVWINPSEFSMEHPRVLDLFGLLHLSPEKIQKKIKDNPKREFLYLKRGLSPELASQIHQFNIPGVNFQPEYHRYYPEGEITAHLLGFTNVDDEGQEGLELLYNHWLGGVQGKKKVVKDRLGRVVKEVSVVQAAQSGHDLILSIDRRIQYISYQALQEAVQRYHAGSGSVIILDVNTGEVISMVNYPSFNPNQRDENTNGRYRNRTVTDVFEPGSTIKPFSMANALEQTHLKPEFKIDTSPGKMTIDNKIVKDIHNYGLLNLREILQHSSNVGISKVTLMTPPQSLWKLLHEVGFGEKTAIGFPGEQPGFLQQVPQRKAFPLAVMSFGYGLSVNALQLAQAYSVFANAGIFRPVTLLRMNQVEPGQRVMEEAVAKEVLHMMESVLESGGTALRARVPGYRVAGKTGTVRMLGPSGYREDRHIGLFIGIAPLSQPRFVTVVSLSDIEGPNYYGGSTAAPVYSKIMSAVLPLFNIAPDAPNAPIQEITPPEEEEDNGEEQDAA